METIIAKITAAGKLKILEEFSGLVDFDGTTEIKYEDKTYQIERRILDLSRGEYLLIVDFAFDYSKAKELLDKTDAEKDK